MAATAWAFYYPAKRRLGQTTSGFAFGTANFRLGLYKSTGGAGDASTKTLSIQSQLSGECTGGAYTQYGEQLASESWTLSGSTYKFDSDNMIITATGTAITSIHYAVIVQSTSGTDGYLLCFSELSATDISVAVSNTITIEMNASGIFTLV